jgi:wyosine [tRNA(Phe)-imidazoG37] synthetase (radical SAM superfamily)
MFGKLTRLAQRKVQIVKRHQAKKQYGVVEVPSVLNIALTNRCNANCIYCRREHRKINKDMNFQFYREILDNVPFIKQVQPQIDGEFFLYEWWPQVIRYAQDLGKSVVIYTNGALLDKTVIGKIMTLEPDKVIFSIDEADSVLYSKLRRGLNFNTVKNNFLMLRGQRDKYNLKIKLAVRICETPENTNRIREIKKYWGRMADEVASTKEYYMPSKEEIKAGGLISAKPILCKYISDGLVIDTSGKLMLCCNDFFDSFELGNLYDIRPLTPEKILDLYNNEKFTKMRDALKAGRNYSFKCHVCQGRSSLVLER